LTTNTWTVTVTPPPNSTTTLYVFPDQALYI
jgi:hypothetical protein